MSSAASREYRHVNGVNSISVPADSEFAAVLADNPEWELVTDQPKPKRTKAKAEPAPEPSPAE